MEKGANRNRKLSALVGMTLIGAAIMLAAVLAPALVPAQQNQTPVYGYKIINTYPHDPKAFTQGLIYDAGVLYESAGLYGQSSLRKVELETGKVLQIRPVESQYFAEGLDLWQGRLIQLTWQEHTGFVYDKESFQLLKNFAYPTTIREGWGLTHDGTRLILSDGSSTIHFLNPETFERVGQIVVQEKETPITRLNELEYINGEIYANIWYSDRIARISPETGQVLGWIELAGLLSPADRPGADVLNGIAYDAEHHRLFVTGKLWPKLFEIELVLKP